MNYVNEVAQFFLSRFPHVSVLGPDDYTLIAEWEKQEIPLTIVEKSIHEIHLSGGKVNKKIETISECEEIVKNNFQDWLKTH